MVLFSCSRTRWRERTLTNWNVESHSALADALGDPFVLPRLRCLPLTGKQIDLGCSFVTNETLPRKEVIQPHLPVRLPCYDFTPITDPTLDACLACGVGSAASGVADFRGVTGGVYKTRERIHRSVLTHGY